MSVVKKMALVRVTVSYPIEFYMDADAIGDGIGVDVGKEIEEASVEDFAPTSHPGFLEWADYATEPAKVLKTEVVEVFGGESFEYQGLIRNGHPLNNGNKFWPEAVEYAKEFLREDLMRSGYSEEYARQSANECFDKHIT